MAHVDWYIEGKNFGNCNCHYGCPCQFEALPTDNVCNGFEVLHIDKGHFGDIDLTGLRTALLYDWPNPIFEGNGQLQVIIDERADAHQREALDYEVDIDARTARVSIPGVVESTGRPIQPPHGGDEHRVRIDIPGGIEFELAEIGSASSKITAAIKLDLNDSYGQWNILRHSSTGVVR